MKKFIYCLLMSLLLLNSIVSATQDINYIVAIVDDDVIVRTELDDAIENISAQLKSQNVSLPSYAILERQVLERLIIQHLQMQFAIRSGINVDDETLNAALRNIANRNQISLNEFRAVLEREGHNFDNFREEIRSQLIIGRLQQREVANHITVTDQEINDFLASANSQMDRNFNNEEGEWQLAQILIAMPEGASSEVIQTAKDKAENLLKRLQSGEDFRAMAMMESESRDALEGGDLGWRSINRIPSLFINTVRGMNKGQIAGPIRSPAGFHIIKLLDYRGQRIESITQTRARHILIRTGEHISDEDAKTRLNQLKIRIEGGDDFGELARAHSEDSATSTNYGSLGWVNQGDLVPEFEQTMNSLSINTISEPFKTSFGWHIVQVLERRQQNNSQENARVKATEAIRLRKIEEELEAWIRRLREEAYVEIRLDTNN